MQISESSRYVRDAIELVKMLEHVCAGGSQASDVPWKGISLTLANVREKLVRAEEVISVEEMIAQNQQIQTPQVQQVRKKTSLAERIQQSPVGVPRVRELISNSSAVGVNGSQSEEDGF